MVFFTVVTDVVQINCTRPKIPWGLSQWYSTMVHLGSIFTMVTNVVPINCTRPKIPWGYYWGIVPGYSKVAWGFFTMVKDVVAINCTRPKIPWGCYSCTVSGYSKVVLFFTMVTDVVPISCTDPKSHGAFTVVQYRGIARRYFFSWENMLHVFS